MSPCSPAERLSGENVGSSPNSGWIPSLALFSLNVFLKHSILTFLSLKKEYIGNARKTNALLKQVLKLSCKMQLTQQEEFGSDIGGAGEGGGGCGHGVGSYIKQVVNSVFKIIIVNC